jgi:two-component system sensor histidine kinase ChvG
VRKIITFNLLGLMILVAGLLYLNTSRDSLAFQRAASLLTEVELIADVFEAQVPAGTPVNLATADGVDAPKTLAELDLRGQSDVFVFDPSAVLVAQSLGAERGNSAALGNPADGGTFITDMLAGAWRG